MLLNCESLLSFFRWSLEKHCKWQRSSSRWSGAGMFVIIFFEGMTHFHLDKTSRISASIGSVDRLRAFSICQNWPAGPLPDQTVWKWNRLFRRVFAEKPSPSCIIFRIWLIWLKRFDWKQNYHGDGNGLAGQFWQMESALRFINHC